MSDPVYRERRLERVPGVLWTSTAPAGQSTILPDGCMDLIWTGQRLLVAGPDAAVATYNSAATTPLVGLRFDPGIAPSVLRERADLLRDRRIDAAQVWGDAKANRWSSTLAAASDPGKALVSLTAAALDDVPDWLAPTVGLLRRGVDVDDVAGQVGVSSRTLRRRVNERIGYGPKLFGRIMRMSAALSTVRATGALSDAAYTHGYSDYPHMQREFVALTGQSPREFA